MKKTLQEIDSKADPRYVEDAGKVRAHLADGKIARWKDLQELGVTQSSLIAMMRRNILTRLGYGSYQLSEEARAELTRKAANIDAEISSPEARREHVDEEMDNYLEPFSEVIARAPKSAICLLSACAFHNLTLDVPHEIWICLEHGSHTPKIDYPPVKAVHWRAASSLTSGVVRHSFRGMEIPVTGLERTVIDLYRYGSRLPDASAPRKALASAMDRKEFDRELLMRLSREFKVRDKVRQDVELLDLVASKRPDEENDFYPGFGM
jgi:hypothetical protein